MERNQITTVIELKVGDRFYKLNDKSKTVYQMVSYKTKTTKYATYAYWCQKPDNIGSRYPNLHAIKPETQVVYLRSATES
ncbi:MAG: hypothetical protein H7289_07735 [Mucilaginibacter sp.]|nr:hypothetical protein [Mucilaginibacter sp.]